MAAAAAAAAATRPTMASSLGQPAVPRQVAAAGGRRQEAAPVGPNLAVGRRGEEQEWLSGKWETGCLCGCRPGAASLPSGLLVAASLGVARPVRERRRQTCGRRSPRGSVGGTRVEFGLGKLESEIHDWRLVGGQSGGLLKRESGSPQLGSAGWASRSGGGSTWARGLGGASPREVAVAWRGLTFARSYVNVRARLRRRRVKAVSRQTRGRRR